MHLNKTNQILLSQIKKMSKHVIWQKLFERKHKFDNMDINRQTSTQLNNKKVKKNHFQQFCQIDIKNCLYNFFARWALLTQVKFLQIKNSDRGSI